MIMEKKFTSTADYQVAEIEIVYRPLIKNSDLPSVNSSEKCYQTFLRSWDEGKIRLIEQFKVMLINHACKTLGILTVSQGGITTCPVDQRLIFAAALKAGATRLILAHNHPSATIKPSECDISLTAKIVKAARLLDIEILDHLIITPERYYSFRDNGLL